MRKLFVLLHIIILVVVFSSSALGGNSGKGAIQVTAEPGIEILLNEVPAGKTTDFDNGLFIGNLDEGEYTIYASKPGYLPISEVLTVISNHTSELQIEMISGMLIEDISSSKKVRMPKSGAELKLQSIPMNARIYLDGKDIGKTDTFVSNIKPGKHVVKIAYKGKELQHFLDIKSDESLVVLGDFKKGKITSKASFESKKFGPEKIVLKSLSGRKPALFPHRKHQGMFDCAECHHSRDAEGNQVEYTEGMKIQHCIACHNIDMPNKKLNTLKLAAHFKCKGCHKKMSESGEAGPIGKCVGCHIK